MSAKKKVFAVSALTLGGIAGATGTAYAAQGGVTTEAPNGTTTAVAEKPQAKKSEAKPSATQERTAEQSAASAPTIAQAERSEPRASSGGGQGGVSTELPAERKAENRSGGTSESTSAQSDAADAPTRAQSAASTPDSAAAQPTPAAQPAPAATVRQASHVTPAQDTTAPAGAPATAPATSNAAPATSDAAPEVAAPEAQTEAADYADVAAVADTSDADAGENQGQGGVVTELPSVDPEPVEGATVEAPADAASTDYSQRVEEASQTPSSEAFAPAAPAEPTGQVATYSAPRDNGGEVGFSGGEVATGTAVEVSETTSYVSNTTTGGGEQATAAQTWDASNGNYNATWATTGGVSGTGGVSATNEQTAPNVGTAGVEGQWSSPDGASSVSVTGGATLENYGVHDASGSIEVNTPVGDMAFTF